MSDENTTPSGDGAENAPAVPMNRAERRAAAKGKKSPAGGGSHGFGSGNSLGNARSQAAGGLRLPRTGHKGG